MGRRNQGHRVGGAGRPVPYGRSARVLTEHRGAALAELRPVLEEQHRRYCERLADLSGEASGAEGAGPVLAAQLVTCRQVLTDLTRALRYLAEDRYGDCVACGEPIPLERLRCVPEAAYCLPCQRLR